jgi:hypothetical protein
MIHGQQNIKFKKIIQWKPLIMIILGPAHFDNIKQRIAVFNSIYCYNSYMY